MNDKPTVSKSRTKRMRKKASNDSRWHQCIPLHGWLQLVLLWAAMMTILHLGREVQVTGLTPGQRAPTTVVALVDFESIDLDLSELQREQAANQVAPVFLVDETSLESHLRDWSKLVDRISMFHARAANSSNGQALVYTSFEDVLDLMELPKQLAPLPSLLDSNRLQELAAELPRAVRRVWQKGIVSADNRRSQFQGTLPQGRIQLGVQGPEHGLAQFQTPLEAVRNTLDDLGGQTELPLELRGLLEDLLEVWIEPNLIQNREQTNLNRMEARNEVLPVTTMIREGTTLMAARSRVSPQVIENLRLHSERLLELEDSRTLLFTLLGHGILLLCAIGSSLLIILLFAPRTLEKPGRMFLWIILSTATMLMAKFLTYMFTDLQLLPPYMVHPLLPLAFAPLLASILRGPAFSTAVGLSTSMGLALSFGLHSNMALAVFASGLAITLVACVTTRAIRKRSNLFRAGLIIGLVKAVLVLGMGVLQEVGALELAQQVAGGFCSGLVISVLVLLLIPPFEVLFKVTTDIRLLELSDMSHPLLTRLALEAPATYHHSLMVAHLAQTAARQIGADDLLVRVCAYYHDIGKMTKPEFFIENIQARENPHDELSPSMSRLVIISHVKEGVSLAQRFKLPHIIIDGIEQHHGTSIIQYFFHRAKVQQQSQAEENGAKVRPEDYRYPGPKPHTVEMGILLLADSVEAASRTIDKTRPGQIENIVSEIFTEKVRDGQLDECGMTFGQLARVKRSFIFTLNNMLHGRIAYPKGQDKNKDEN